MTERQCSIATELPLRSASKRPYSIATELPLCSTSKRQCSIATELSLCSASKCDHQSLEFAHKIQDLPIFT